MAETKRFIRMGPSTKDAITLHSVDCAMEEYGQIIVLAKTYPSGKDTLQAWLDNEVLRTSEPAGFWLTFKTKAKIFLKTGKWVNAQIRVTPLPLKVPKELL